MYDYFDADNGLQVLQPVLYQEFVDLPFWLYSKLGSSALADAIAYPVLISPGESKTGSGRAGCEVAHRRPNHSASILREPARQPASPGSEPRDALKATVLRVGHQRDTHMVFRGVTDLPSGRRFAELFFGRCDPVVW